MRTFVTLALLLTSAASSALTPQETHRLLVTLDERQKSAGDFTSLVYMERHERDKNDVIFEAAIYRREEGDKMVIYFTRPKEEAGKGYLRVDRNLFLYDPTIGKWERRTQRERIGGTDSRQHDFRESRFAVDFEARWLGEEKLGQFAVDHVELHAREGADVAYPAVHLWIDRATGNVLKQQEFALSGRLMRTSYYPKWTKAYSPVKKADVYVAAEIRIFDEVEKGNHTTVVMRKVDLNPVEDSIFTKAWLEGRSR